MILINVSVYFVQDCILEELSQLEVQELMVSCSLRPLLYH